MTHESRAMWPGAHPALRGLRIAGMVVLGIVGAAIFALAFGWLVMILWNWLMPVIFHLGVLSYWQAFGVVILAKLIFGGIGGRGPGGGKYKHHGRGNPWKGNPWEGRHGTDQWHLYREYWEQEGRESFEKFVKSKTDPQEPHAGSPATDA
jgi:hypothetical protein